MSIDLIRGCINLRSKGDRVVEMPFGGRVVAHSEGRSRKVDSQFFSPIYSQSNFQVACVQTITKL